MFWPDSLIVLDDADSALAMADILGDLSWLKNPREYIERQKLIAGEELKRSIEEEVKILPRELVELADPNVLRSRIISVKVDSPNKVHNAVAHVQRDGSAIAFIDFSYQQAPAAHAALVELYDNCPEEWKIAESDGQKGGCVFASFFKPNVNQPVRLLCPTTQNPPEFLGRPAGGALTRHIALQAGPANMMRAVIFALRKWFDLQDRFPLENIWESTMGWFRDEDTSRSGHFSIDNMPHTLPTSADLDSYRTTFENVFRIETPTEWWSDIKSVRHIHETLKHLCGANYCGTATAQEGAKYNLCVGAVYIIGLLAMRDVSAESTCERLTRGIKTFDSLGLIHRSMILPLQTPQIARKGARSLYYLLKELFREDPKHATPEGKIPSVKSAHLLSGGSRLLIEFDGWNGSKLASTLSGKLQDLSTTAKWYESQRAQLGGQKIAFHLFSMWESFLINELGFGSPGAIWMETDKLYIQGATGIIDS